MAASEAAAPESGGSKPNTTDSSLDDGTAWWKRFNLTAQREKLVSLVKSRRQGCEPLGWVTCWSKVCRLSGNLHNRLQDKVSVEIADKQAAAAENRKVLTAALVGYRRADASEQPGMVQGMISQFKGEVDFQTRRARFAERAFVSLYSALFEAPDPAPLIARAREAEAQAVEAKAEADAAKADRDAYVQELSALRNQDLEVSRSGPLVVSLRSIASCRGLFFSLLLGVLLVTHWRAKFFFL
jgi:hypothetical protein